MTACADRPVSRALRRAIAARRMERAAWLSGERSRRSWATGCSLTVRDRCECCGRVVVVSALAIDRGTVITADCGGGVIAACVHCARLGYGSDPLLADPPYIAGGLAGPLAGPRRVLP